MKKSVRSVCTALILTALLRPACRGAPASPLPTATLPPPALSATPGRTVLLALSPSATSAEQQASGEALARQLSALTGLNVKTTVPPSYNVLIEAMGAGNAQIGWLPPFAYTAAHQKGFADAALATTRLGSERRGVQFIANAVRGFTTAIAVTDTAVLSQFEGKRPCWTDPLSSSGYVIPLGILNSVNVTPAEGAFVHGNPEVVNAIYSSPTGETCDFGATFIDARIGVNLPDVNQRVVVIYQSDPIIPNDAIAYAPDLPPDLRATLTEAFLQIAATEEGRRAIKDVYQADGLRAIDDSFYNAFRRYLNDTGLDATTLIE